MANQSVIPHLYKYLLYKAEVTGLLEENLKKRFRKVEWYHLEIAELMFLHGYCRIKGVPWGKTDIKLNKCLLNQH